ncbi:thermonuclease family protein [Acaryochloris sp. IP29b_bin.137]|nr:thermonuclease family protein [Acaryochloris sp. IP29b_bin.137]
MVKLREITTDQYRRTVTKIYSKGKSVDLKLVSEGYAVVYY